MGGSPIRTRGRFGKPEYAGEIPAARQPGRRHGGKLLWHGWMAAPVAFEPVEVTLPAGFDDLAAAATAEGHPFLARLAAEWASGHNRFDRPGERLIAVRDGGALAAIGGLNRDPLLDDPTVARLRHVYVHPGWRRRRIGALLTRELIATARTAGFARPRFRTPNP